MMRNRRGRTTYRGLTLYEGLTLLWIAGSAVACGAPAQRTPDTQSQAEENVQADMSAVQKRLTEIVMARPGVVGIGQSLCGGNPCFRVYVSKLTPELQRRIPKRFEGIAVEVVESGDFRAQDR
jgi:hypothetical protein